MSVPGTDLLAGFIIIVNIANCEMSAGGTIELAFTIINAIVILALHWQLVTRWSGYLTFILFCKDTAHLLERINARFLFFYDKIWHTQNHNDDGNQEKRNNNNNFF